MGKLFQAATEQSALRAAWHRIRANGTISTSPETRVAIEMFDRDEIRNISRIQRRLRCGEFEFEPQHGVLKNKSTGGKRGIVMASVHNRVVERAWLDCLQRNSQFIRKVITQPTSVGGVPHRSVPHGLKLINEAFLSGKRHYIRSDISGFFDHIPRDFVIEQISKDVNDVAFVNTLRDATRVVLANEATLGDDRKVFPTDEEGVAQGSPLSPLFGNVLLYDFDLRFNERGVVCVRFIDDFVLLADTESAVTKAFENAKKSLASVGLGCHDPFSGKQSLDKASFGKADDGFVFLGYDIRPGLFQPSKQVRQKLEKAVDGHLYLARKAISEVRKAANSFESRNRYVQTLSLIDRVLRGWGEAFAYNNAPGSIEDLDWKIDEQISRFKRWFASQLDGQDWKTKRRLGGVCLLGDVRRKSLDDVPFVLESRGRFVRSSNTVTISTDGSVAVQVKKKGKDQGPGGWSFVIHETGQVGVGYALSATNNRMELTAVIEAIKAAQDGRSIVIRTDSQYVHDAVNRSNTIKSNSDLWKQFQSMCKSRRVKIVWVKGHAGDPHNEQADKLAAEQAKLALKHLSSTSVAAEPGIDGGRG